ncbi:MAG: HlyD family efflux transporter periplasmic adaptor subunit, partial [Pseudomonadota bacterium]
MSANARRILFWAGPALALAALIVWALRPQPVEVDLVTVTSGPITVTVAETGETRIRDVFMVSAPLLGRVLRIDIEAGDTVVAGETVVAEIEPAQPAFLDERSAAEAGAALAAAEAAVLHGEAALLQAEADLDFARAEFERMQALRANDRVSARALEEAERLFRTREAAFGTAIAAVAMRRAEMRAAEARLIAPVAPTDAPGAEGRDCVCVPIRAPVSGHVLRVLHESEGIVSPGTPLIEIGNPRDLEVAVDFLSSDAVRIEPGQRAILSDWGGPASLNAVVKRVEPYGVTRISALGIEEQRVDVILSLTDPPAEWNRLGHGFEIEA